MIEAMWRPTHVKDTQKLMGCLAALSQFISRLVGHALIFFKLMWKSGSIVWTEEADEAFHELKWYLTSPPVMVAPEPGEPLLLYITTTTEVVSMVLVVERSEPQQPQVSKGVSAGGFVSQDPDPPPQRARRQGGCRIPAPGALSSTQTPSRVPIPRAHLGSCGPCCHWVLAPGGRFGSREPRSPRVSAHRGCFGSWGPRLPGTLTHRDRCIRPLGEGLKHPPPSVLHQQGPPRC
jgi:hypothetical protein